MKSRFLHFDRELTLAESLSALPRERLERALAKSIGKRWQVVDDSGTPVIGPYNGTADMADAATSVPLRLDMEIVGHLLAPDAPRAQIEAAAEWLEMVLAASSRYRMAADLHLEASHADFEKLQSQHGALLASETRYRELSEQLDQRVQSQVALIEQAQRHIYQAEKLVSIGSLAAGMAHEINNPIGFIRSNLSTALGYVGQLASAVQILRGAGTAAMPEPGEKTEIDFVLEDFPALLTESISGADRIARIVANLKEFSNIDCTGEGSIDMNEVIRAVSAVIGDQLPQTISIEMNLHPLLHVDCDRSRMNQVMFSIIQNAQQALGEKGGQIRVASSMANGEIQIAVSDDGAGIKPENLTRIFDPFFTTRDVGKGTGLGLTVSRDIVLTHGGRIDVRSQAGIGSTFTVCLPASDGAEAGKCPGELM